MTPVEALEGQFELFSKVTGEKVSFEALLDIYEKLLKQQHQKTWFEQVRSKYLQQYIGCIDSPTAAVLGYLLAKKRTDNSISTTHRKIAEEVGTSLPTVTKTLMKLQKLGLLRKISNGTYMLNPKVMSRGGNRYFGNLDMWEKLNA